MDVITKLNSMKKPELLKLARTFNNEFKIKNVHKLKKQQLLTELVLRQEQVREILKGNVTLKAKGKRMKKEKSDDEKNEILKKIIDLQKKAIQGKASEKPRLFREIAKLQRKL